jgi:hypothetical protein
VEKELAEEVREQDEDEDKDKDSREGVKSGRKRKGIGEAREFGIEALWGEDIDLLEFGNYDTALLGHLVKGRAGMDIVMLVYNVRWARTDQETTVDV